MMNQWGTNTEQFNFISLGLKHQITSFCIFNSKTLRATIDARGIGMGLLILIDTVNNHKMAQIESNQITCYDISCMRIRQLNANSSNTNWPQWMKPVVLNHIKMTRSASQMQKLNWKPTCWSWIVRFRLGFDISFAINVDFAIFICYENIKKVNRACQSPEVGTDR